MANETLRSVLTTLVLDGLEHHQMTQSELADKIGKSSEYVKQVLGGDPKSNGSITLWEAMLDAVRTK